MDRWRYEIMNEKEVKKAEIFSEIEMQINKMDNKS